MNTVFTLSSAQQRLWLADQAQQGLPAYHICRVIDVAGVGEAVLRQGLRDVMGRHEALRVAVAALDGQPLQRVTGRIDVELPVLEFADESASDTRAVQAVALPFDLTRGQLLRAELHVLPHASRLVLVLHHIVADAWSVDLVLRDLRAACAARAAGEAPDWTPVRSYRDYVAWERAWLTGPECARQVAYWDERLAGLEPNSEHARRRPGAMLPFIVQAEHADELRKFSRDHGLTLAAVCLAGFAAVLHRWNNADDVVIGVPFANRADGAWAQVAGLFVNTLPIRLRLSGDPLLCEIAGQARDRLLEALTHAQVPLDRLSVPASFNVTFSLLPASVVDETARRIYSGQAKFELNLEIIDHGPGRPLAALLEHDLSVCDTARAQQLTQAVVAALSGMDAAVSVLPLTQSPAVAGRLTSPADNVAELFAEVAAAHPDRVALIDAADGSSMSYRELHSRVTAIAEGLAAAGVGRGDYVGLHLPRGADLVLGILGTLTAGAAYVPLDPEYPLARTRALINAAGVSLLVSDLSDVLDDSGVIAGPGTADDAAYVMFTSGSTGAPKGVVVPHRAIVRLVRGTDFMPMTPDDRWLHLSAPAFDASTLELWAALLNGGCVVVLGGSPSAADIGAVVAKHGVTNAWFTAGLFHVIVDEELDALRPLRTVLTGGDVVSPDHVRRVLALGVTVVNGYGPTENTTFTTCHVMRSVTDVSEPLPIGRPVNGTTVQIVDRYLQPVPVGVPGEILAGGAGLARGYAGRPAATAQAFVPGPGGQRLYRTGDRGYLDVNGVVHFLGRQDNQAKVRGFRVEPGEIEAALLALDGVQQAAVVAHEGRLIGHFVGSTTPERLMDQLSAALPGYLVPRQWVRLDALPLGPTGKVDRRALPMPQGMPLVRAAEPRTVTEQLIVAWASDLLGVEADLDTDFYAAGGHSLLASRLAARIRATFGTDVSLGTVLATPRLGELAAEVATMPRLDLPQLAPGPRTELSFAQERMLFLHKLSNGSAEYHMPLSLRLTGPIDLELWRQRLQSLVDRHPILRTVYEPMRVLADVTVPLVIEDLSLLPVQDSALAEVAAVAFHRPFDLATDLPIRATLVRLAPDRHELLLCVHHIAADGASMMLLLNDLVERAQRRSDVEYADYARWQREALNGPAGQRLEDYWRTQLAGVPQRLMLADQPEVPHNRGALHRVRLDRTLAQAAGGTVYTTLLTAFAMVVARRTGERDLLIGTPVDNRDHPAVSDVVGLFLNTLPVRCRLSDTFAESQESVRKSSVDALAHAGLPFERIVELAGVAREMGEHPLVQVMFAVQPAVTRKFPGIEIVGAHHGTAKCDLTVSLFDDGTQLEGFVEYRTDRFDAAFVAQLWDEFMAVLQGDPLEPVDRGSFGRVPTPPELPRSTADPGVIADIWAEVLEIPRPVPDDDFFALGGHSLAAMRMVARLRERLGKDVPLRAIFDASTLGAFAALVQDAPVAKRRQLVARPDLTLAPLSPAQERHWVLYQLDPESTAQNVPLVLQLHGPVDVATLERALTTVAVRHSILRTVFEVRDGVPVQVIEAAQPIVVSGQPWDGPFDLTAAPPWHVALTSELQLHITLHHILADGWSVSVLLRELAAAYQGISLTPLSIQYADHARHLAESDVDASWWRERLSGVPMLDLPTDRPRGAEPSYLGGEHVLTVDPARRRALELLAREHGGTLFTAVYTVFAAMLGRYSGQSDFAIGTFHAGRNDPAIDPLIGFFVNNVALRASLAGDPTWTELLTRLSRAVTEDFEHADVPFERVVEALGVPRSLRQTPVFSAMCVLQNLPTLPDRFGDVGVELVRRPYQRADFDVTLWLREARDGGLAGALSYDADLFTPATIARLADLFATLLEECLDPDPVRCQIRPNFDTSRDLDHQGLLVRLEERAAATPEATALVWRGGGMSYRELWQRSGGVAASLRDVGAETLVGVHMGRSAEAVAAFIGVMRAGAAYVPIDPAYPESYKQDCALILSEAAGESAFVSRAGHPEQLAYAIFTSGSTGRPKAVLVSRSNLDSYLSGIEPALGLTAQDRVLNFASISFDATTEELYPALLAGATVVLRPSELNLPDEEWDEFLAATTPTVLSLPVTFWQAWVERLVAENLKVPEHVHTLLLNAEEPSARHYAQWLGAGGDRVRFVNTYGPTEGTVTATLYEPGEDVELWQRFPIGVRLSNMEIRIADRDGRTVPDGAVGELCLGGAAITRGYLGQAALTADLYRPGEGGRRCYRTGDLARLLPSGQILLLGRADRQVKIRGYRVELGGVEAVLNGHPPVRAAAVIARERDGVRELVAYVATDLSEEEIRGFLATRLPVHAVPSHVHVLTDLPLNTNQKIDRAALARIEPQTRPTEEMSPREALLASVWREVLGREGIGRHDNFFAIGGDSIRGLQVVMRARDAGFALTARDLFVHQTIAEQAALSETEIRRIPAQRQPQDDKAANLTGHQLGRALGRIRGGDTR